MTTEIYTASFSVGARTEIYEYAVKASSFDEAFGLALKKKNKKNPLVKKWNTCGIRCKSEGGKVWDSDSKRLMADY
jgi:hypothetical protein